MTKGVVENYKLQFENGHSSIIKISDEINNGKVEVYSEYGHYVAFCENIRMPFKRYLLTLDMDYFAILSGQHDFIDVEATFKNFREQAEEYILTNELTDEDVIAIRKELSSETELRITSYQEMNIWKQESKYVKIYTNEIGRAHV